MDPIAHLRRLFAYDDWANREAWSSLAAAAAGGLPPQALRLLAHAVAAEELWLGRLKQEKKKVVVWPDLTLEQCGEQIDELRGLWEEYLSALGPEDLARPVSYVNSQGEPWTNTVEDILMHTVTHSVYHRGQIAAALRTAGEEPAYTDFIHAVRQGRIE